MVAASVLSAQATTCNTIGDQIAISFDKTHCAPLQPSTFYHLHHVCSTSSHRRKNKNLIKVFTDISTFMRSTCLLIHYIQLVILFDYPKATKSDFPACSVFNPSNMQLSHHIVVVVHLWSIAPGLGSVLVPRTAGFACPCVTVLQQRYCGLHVSAGASNL